MKIIPRLFTVSHVLFAALLGCDSSSGDASINVEFSNESSSTVNVTPQGDETFIAFSLSPGQSTTVERSGDEIDFSFTASGDVDGITLGEVEVIFTDPQ